MTTTLKKSIFVIALLAAVLATAWFAFLRTTRMPAIQISTLQGQALSNADLRGKVVLVNFWATTCTTCMAEMPELRATWQKYNAQGYEMLAVAMDYDNPDWIRDYQSRSQHPFWIAQDVDGAVARAFGSVQLTPTSFLIDRQGHIVQQILGKPDFASFHKTLERLLAQGA